MQYTSSAGSDTPGQIKALRNGTSKGGKEDPYRQALEEALIGMYDLFWMIFSNIFCVRDSSKTHLPVNRTELTVLATCYCSKQ